MYRVLVATDGSASSEQALQYALNRYTEASIRVLHVVEASTIPNETRTDAVDRAKAEASAALETAVDIAREHGRDVETDTTPGHAAKAVVAYADEEEFDEIVVGSEGKTGAKRLLLGSVAESIARRASCPVTIVR